MIHQKKAKNKKELISGHLELIITEAFLLGVVRYPEVQ